MNLAKGFAFLVSLLIAALFAQNAVAVPVEIKFDFEDADYLGGPAEIEDYMEDIYGSEITVDGGRVGTGWFKAPLGPDRYIFAGFCGKHSFSFSFDEIPITSVSFDWGVRFDAFHAYADDVEIFDERWHCWDSGNSGTIFFEHPVTKLEFTDSCFGDIEVDNLIVTPVPEPAAISLLGLGTLLMLRKPRLATKHKNSKAPHI